MDSEQHQAQLQQLEERFSHVDLDHPALRKLYEIQSSALQPDEQE